MLTPFNALPEDIIRRELRSGEELLWSGQPRQGIFLRAQDIFLIPFSLMWGGFAIFWEVSVVTIAFRGPLQGDARAVPLMMSLFGLPFVAIGLMLIFGRFFVDRRMRAGTYYGVTDRRVIIVSGLFARGVTSLELNQISGTTLTERRDGTGDITLGPRTFQGAMLPRYWPSANRVLPPTLEYIREPRTVYDLIVSHGRG